MACPTSVGLFLLEYDMHLNFSLLAKKPKKVTIPLAYVYADVKVCEKNSAHEVYQDANFCQVCGGALINECKHIVDSMPTSYTIKSMKDAVEFFEGKYPSRVIDQLTDEYQDMLCIDDERIDKIVTKLMFRVFSTERTVGKSSIEFFYDIDFELYMQDDDIEKFLQKLPVAIEKKKKQIVEDNDVKNLKAFLDVFFEDVTFKFTISEY